MTTYGQGLAAMILTAKDFGLDPGYQFEAKEILAGRGIKPTMIGHLENEALNAKSEIAKMERLQEADGIAALYLTHYCCRCESAPCDCDGEVDEREAA
jgi:hypothetical protein